MSIWLNEVQMIRLRIAVDKSQRGLILGGLCTRGMCYL